MLSRLRREPDLLEGCTAALIVDGPGELYTKSTAGELALAADMAGCALIGRPLVEGTGSLANFRIQAKNLGTDHGWGPIWRRHRSWSSVWTPSLSPKRSGLSCWSSTPPATTHPTPWPCGQGCGSGWGRCAVSRRSACATGHWTTAPAVPTPCVSTSGRRGSASMAESCPGRSIPRCAGRRGGHAVPQLQRRTLR